MRLPPSEVPTIVGNRAHAAVKSTSVATRSDTNYSAQHATADRELWTAGGRSLSPHSIFGIHMGSARMTLWKFAAIALVAAVGIGSHIAAASAQSVPLSPSGSGSGSGCGNCCMGLTAELCTVQNPPQLGYSKPQDNEWTGGSSVSLECMFGKNGISGQFGTCMDECLTAVESGDPATLGFAGGSKTCPPRKNLIFLLGEQIGVQIGDD